MADFKMKYGTNTALTCTLANLGTGSSRISDAQDNSGTLAMDAMVTIKLTLLTGGTTGNDNACYIYFYNSQDGTNYADNATGVDSAFTLRDPNNFRGPFVVAFATATGAPVANAVIPSVATFFGGQMPVKWGVIVQNKTNTPLNTSTTMTASYTNLFIQSV